jgi:Zn-dependent protease
MDLFGFRIGVDVSWFVILFLMIFWLSGDFRVQLGSSDGVAYMTAVATALALFASLIVHELGHALVARREGITVTRIDLLLFGGITQMSRDAATPGEDFRIAAAGPLATLGVVILCLVVDLIVVGPHRVWRTASLGTGFRVTPGILILVWLLVWNVALLAFNLVPAFPLDGGRIARSLVWRLTGSKGRGTRLAAAMGQCFAVVLGVLGVWLMVSAGALNGLWLVALAFMLGQSARAALVQSTLSERIETMRVADIMDTRPVAIADSMPVAQAQEEFFLRYGWEWFPVTDGSGRLVGIVRSGRVQELGEAGQGWLSITAALEADGAGLPVDQDQPITAVLSSEWLARLGAVPAVDQNGVLRGVVTAAQLRRAVQAALGSRLG